MPTPSIQTLRADAQQVLNLDSISAVRSVVAATLANANAGTPLNPNLTTQQLWNEFYQIVTQPKSDIESIIANQLMKFLYAPPAPGGVGADGQVIFNDGGVLAGDPQFLWNKTTNLLTVTGSATITGAATVGTTLGVTGVSTFAAGTALLPALTTTGDTNTGIYYPAADTFAVTTGGTERYRVDSSGNVGIGVTPSAWGGSYKALQLQSVARSIAATGAGAGDLTVAFNAIYDSTDSRWEYAGTGDKAGRYSQTGSGNHRWFVSNTVGTAGNEITDFANAAMTLDASGNLAIGVAATGTRRLEVKSDGTTNTTFAAHFRDSADVVLFSVRSDGYFNTGTSPLSPYNLITASAANMFVDSSGFVYRSTSSLKYKTDVKDSIHGLADVLKLRSVTYKSKNGDDTVFGGLIAEEVHAAGLTEFVAYAPDKTPDSINYGNMVALLASAIQELTTRVQTLEAK
jgi:hypothetical protein